MPLFCGRFPFHLSSGVKGSNFARGSIVSLAYSVEHRVKFGHAELFAGLEPTRQDQVLARVLEQVVTVGALHGQSIKKDKGIQIQALVPGALERTVTEVGSYRRRRTFCELNALQLLLYWLLEYSNPIGRPISLAASPFSTVTSKLCL